MNEKKYLKLIWLLLLLFGLAGCHPFVRYPKPPVLSKSAAVGAVGGAGIGAEVGAASGASVAASTGIGALVGLGLGAYWNSEVHWLKRLQKDSVQVVQTGHFVRIIIPADKIFEFNSSEVVPQCYPILTDVAHFIENYGPVPITVTGYTDAIGSPVANLELSHARAKRVAGYLWTHGISFAHLRAVGLGSANPVAANDNPVGAYHNRRIEITFSIA